MPTLRFVVLVALLAITGTAPASAGAKKDAWKADTQPPAGPSSEIPSYCKPLAALIENRLAKLRAIRVSIEQQKTAPSTSVLEFTEKLMGNPYETDWERQQKAALAKGKAEAAELNERYKGQKCGSIDIEQGIARAPDAAPYKPLVSKEPRMKFKKNE